MRVAQRPSFEVLPGGKAKGAKKAGEKKRQLQFTETNAFPLITGFRNEYPGGSDRQLMEYMGADSIETARYWRRRYEAKTSAAG